MKPIEAGLVEALNDIQGGITLSHGRPAELTIELEQLRAAVEQVAARVAFDAEPAEFRAALLALAERSAP